MASAQMTVGRYLVERVAQTGVRHAFGVPGDYVLDLMDVVAASPIRLVTTCNELNAGYAADGYARMHGVGALVLTYNVGALSAVNAVAGAFAERVPVIVISGAPHTRLTSGHALMHHLVRRYDTQRAVYEKITACAVLLNDPRAAPEQIDRAISTCLRLKRPVYIEVPVDIVGQPCEAEDRPAGPPPQSDEAALAESVREAAAMLRRARHPAVLVGMEARRFKLQEPLLALLERGGFPVAATIGGKTALPETHEHYVGVYQGGFTDGAAHDTIEGADCLLSLGAWMTDVTTGGFTAHLDPGRMINANSDKVRIRHHVYEQILLGDFIERLTAAIPGAAPGAHAHAEAAPYRVTAPFAPERGRRLTAARFFERMGHFIGDGQLVVCDTGDVMFGATELPMRATESFISQDYYLSIGYSLPAALGVALAAPERRAVVFIGDGAFQMTGNELGAFARVGAHPVIFVLNNDGYLIERLIHDGPYNDIARWSYHRLPEALAAGIGLLAHTEGELEDALDLARRRLDTLVLIEIQVDRVDSTPTLARVAANVRTLSKE